MIKRDLGEERSLRGHCGRHDETVERLVQNDDFVEMNRPLRDVRPGRRVLLIGACNHGRHRSVVDSAVLYRTFLDRWFHEEY